MLDTTDAYNKHCNCKKCQYFPADLLVMKILPCNQI